MPVPESVTAIVLTKKRPKELGGVLDSLVNQHRPPNEIIVMDNDPEGSGRAANHINDFTVRYMCVGEDLGEAEGRNRAAAHARGDLLVFIDDNSRFEKFSAISSMVNCFTEDDIAVLAFPVRNAETKEIVPKNHPAHSRERFMDIRDVAFFYGGACAILRETFKKLGGYDDALGNGGEELEFAYRLTKEGLRIRYIPDIAVLHRGAPDMWGDQQDAFSLIRNHLYIAMKHLPMPYLATQVTAWSLLAFGQALKTFKFGDYFRGIGALKAEGLAERANAYRQENPMGRDVIQYLLKHYGRVWY